MIASTCLGVGRMDETSQKIIDATMSLIRDKEIGRASCRERV